MDWLQSLLWDPSSVAHIVLLYAFVVAAGVYLGKIKIFGVSLGVTFVLFAGILMGQDRKSTRLNSSHPNPSRMPSSA